MDTSTWSIHDGVDLEKIGIYSCDIEHEHENWVKLRQHGWIKRKMGQSMYFLKSFYFLSSISDPTKFGVMYFCSMKEVNEYLRLKLDLQSRLRQPGSKPVTTKDFSNKKRQFKDFSTIHDDSTVVSGLVAAPVEVPDARKYCIISPPLPSKVCLHIDLKAL